MQPLLFVRASRHHTSLTNSITPHPFTTPLASGIAVVPFLRFWQYVTAYPTPPPRPPPIHGSHPSSLVLSHSTSAVPTSGRIASTISFSTAIQLHSPSLTPSGVLQPSYEPPPPPPSSPSISLFLPVSCNQLPIMPRFRVHQSGHFPDTPYYRHFVEVHQRGAPLHPATAKSYTYVKQISNAHILN